jgi:hypothetical protein
MATMATPLYQVFLYLPILVEAVEFVLEPRVWTDRIILLALLPQRNIEVRAFIATILSDIADQ